MFDRRWQADSVDADARQIDQSSHILAGGKVAISHYAVARPPFTSIRIAAAIISSGRHESDPIAPATEKAARAAAYHRGDNVLRGSRVLTQGFGLCWRENNVSRSNGSQNKEGTGAFKGKKNTLRSTVGVEMVWRTSPVYRPTTSLHASPSY